MRRRRFGVNLLSTPEYYIFSEEEAKNTYYNLCRYLQRTYNSSDYCYSILVGLSNVDGKTVLRRIKSDGVGRHTNIFVANDNKKGIRYVNWHLHIMVCGAPLNKISSEIVDYMQRILNVKLINEEFDKRVYESKNFIKYYGSYKRYGNELEMLLSRLGQKRVKEQKRVPKCSLSNLNVNIRKTKNSKDNYIDIERYIKKQSILEMLIESNDFKLAYFDIAKELNLLAKGTTKNYWNTNKNKTLSR